MKIKKITSALWPVNVPISADGGVTEDEKIWVRFEKIPSKDEAEWAQKPILDLLRHVVKGLGETQESVKADAELLEEALEEEHYTFAMYNAYLDFKQGIAAKN